MQYEEKLDSSCYQLIDSLEMMQQFWVSQFLSIRPDNREKTIILKYDTAMGLMNIYVFRGFSKMTIVLGQHCKMTTIFRQKKLAKYDEFI